MKRLFIIVTLLLTMLLGLLAVMIYFFNINDYSDWISKQIESSTGYQNSFAEIKKSNRCSLCFSLKDLEVAIDENSHLHIDKINIDIGKLDLWGRRLDVERLALFGIDLSMEENAFKKLFGSPKNSATVSAEKKKSISLFWSDLRIKQLQISNLNAHLRYAEKELLVQRANLNINNLLLIEHQQLAVLLSKGNLQFSSQTLRLQLSAEQAVTLAQLSLNSDFDLPARQIKLAVMLKKLEFTLPEQTAITVDNSLLDMQLDRNKISLTRLFFNVFSGELQLQADALLSINRSAAVPWSVSSVTVETLLLKNMKVKVPSFMAPAENIVLNNTQQTAKVPVKTLFIKKAALQNIDISSEEPQLPIIVNGLNARLLEFYLLQNNQLVDLSEDPQANASFALKFTYLQWMDSFFEQFQVAGSFAENSPEWQLLQSFYIDQSTKD